MLVYRFSSLYLLCRCLCCLPSSSVKSLKLLNSMMLYRHLYLLHWFTYLNDAVAAVKWCQWWHFVESS